MIDSPTFFGFLAAICGVFESLCTFFGIFLLILTQQSFIGEMAEKATFKLKKLGQAGVGGGLQAEGGGPQPAIHG